MCSTCAAPVRPRRFLPGVPHLPYQYRLYSNLAPPAGATLAIDEPNPDIDADPALDAWGASLREWAAAGGAGGARQSGVPRGESALTGGGNSASFEAMLEAALRESE